MKEKSAKEKTAREILKLAESIGNFIEYWGFKAIHGKIWTLLYLSKTPLSAIELSRRLKVSKTLLSFSIAQLLEYEVIQNAGKGAKRTVYFRANPDLTGVIYNVFRMREQPMFSELYSNFLALKKLSEKEIPGSASLAASTGFNLDASRVAQVGEWIGAAQSALNALVSNKQGNLELVQQFLLLSKLLSSSEDTSGRDSP